MTINFDSDSRSSDDYHHVGLFSGKKKTHLHRYSVIILITRWLCSGPVLVLDCCLQVLKHVIFVFF